MSWSILIVAKSPVPGRVKTRLCPPLTAEQAADLAAAALLDTLAVAELAVDGDRDRMLLALDGELIHAARWSDLSAAVQRWRVLPQRGESFAERLANAHADALQLRPGRATVQIGMDTPHVSPGVLRVAAGFLGDVEAVLGNAADGGWWLLGLRDPRAADVLADVQMSCASTAADTRRALCRRGLTVGTASLARDIDEWADALASARLAPHTLTAASVNQHTRVLA